MTPHQKGLLLTAFGGMVLTFDIPLLKLADGEQWSVLFVRYACGLAVALIAWGVIGLVRRRPIVFVPGKTGLVVAAIYGCGALGFTTAVFHTTAANLVFILSFNTMFAALLAWIFLGERPARPTLVTMAVMVACVALIVGDGFRSGHTFGNLLALGTSFLLASGLTITRASGRDMGFTPMVGGVLPVAVAVIVLTGTESTYQVAAPWWLYANGALLIPISFWCLATGPKYITGPEVAMFFLLETVLAPVWVWIIFNEKPTVPALVGGTIIIVALTLHSLWQLRREREERGRPARWLYPSMALKRPRA